MKSELRRICAAMLIAVFLLTNLCGISLADEGIQLKPVIIDGMNITVEGTLPDSSVRNVSVFVLPKNVGDYTIDSAESFLEANSDGGLLGEYVFVSQTKSTSEGFVFKFTMGDTGAFAVLVSAEDMAGIAYSEFRILSFSDVLNDLSDNYAEFSDTLKNNFSYTGAVNLDKYLLLTDEYKDKVYFGIFEMAEFADMEELTDIADTQILAVINGILNDFKLNSGNADMMLSVMRSMQELFGVTKLVIYDNSLNTEGKEAVKSMLSSKISLCTSLEQLGGYFDSEVLRQVSLFEGEIVGGFNLAEDTEEFERLLKENGAVLNLTDEETALLNHLSKSMKARIFEFMIDLSDNNDDGKSDFADLEEITDAYRQTLNTVGESDLVLDIINNRDNKEELTDILKKYLSLLAGIDMTGYEALGDTEDSLYRKYVIENFLKGEADESLSAVVERFNSIVSDASRLKAMLDRINQANYTNMIALLSYQNMNIMNVSESTRSNYQYVSSHSVPEHTNLINNLVKYIPYVTLEDFLRTFDTEAKASYDKLTANTGSGSSGSSGGSFGSSSKQDYVVTGHVSAGNVSTDKTIFADVDSVPWAKAQILFLAEKGIINGVEKDKFAPMDNVTREQFVKLLVGAFGLTDGSASCNFADVPADSWFYIYVASGYKLGLVKGVDLGLFGAGQNITREDMALLAYRAYQKIKGDISVDSTSLFEDDYNISGYSKDAVYALKALGIINGTGNNVFNSKATCTRAEAAVIIYNILNQ